MSNIQNENWLENAYDNFKQSLHERNFEQAKAVIADTRGSGFEDGARIMELELQDDYIYKMHKAFEEYTKNYKRMLEVIEEKMRTITKLAEAHNENK